MSNTLSSDKKWVVALYTALIFVLIFNPLTFKFVNYFTSAIGFPTATSKGRPNGWGLILHGVVLVLALRALMEFKNLPGLEKK